MAQMNLFKKIVGCLLVLAALFVLAGCETGAGTTRSGQQRIMEFGFQVGELVTVKFSGLDTALPDHEERIKEDGTITLAQIGSVKAEGKTPGQLQKDIRALFVP